eukprot:TRINITY_DN2514_c0_g1_i1.p1 TRINITY_DN2514_c0_g1~~TRINITY_DN2514_c0_g1_i1.p1  ORF type:complete len:300 (+),score=62.92 TRINITY_DN2514_c0_g1_i1:151-1050(+)
MGKLKEKPPPKLKVSLEYDSETGVPVNKLSAKLFNGFAKLKASAQVHPNGELSYPLLGIFSKFFSVDYDVEDRNALVRLSADVHQRVRLSYRHDVNAQQGAIVADWRDKKDKFRGLFTYEVPVAALTRVDFSFPTGEVRYVDEPGYGESSGISGFVGGKALKGLVLAEARLNDPSLNLKYTYKDSEATVIPCISLPSKAVTLQFKRQFDAKRKLSFMYDFQSVSWNMVLKNKPHDDLKMKLGYDSEKRLGWGSLWIGKEGFGAKQGPGKFKAQAMIQIPQDSMRDYLLLFKIKKRWDMF